MASEIRVNDIKNRSGLGTVTFTDTGLLISGITSFSLGNTNLIVGSATSTGTASQRLQVTGGAYVSGNLGLGVSNPGAVIHSYAVVTGGSPSTSGSTDANVAARFQASSVNFDVGVLSAGPIWLQPRLSSNFASNFNLLLCPNGGNIGIATTTPSEKLHVIGNIIASGNVSGYSDKSLKDNIQTIPNAIDKVIQLRGVEFDRNDIEGNPHQIGVIAQEVEEIIPEVITTHNDGLKSVAYGNLVGLLIEAIKDLKEEVNELKIRLEEK